MKESLRLTSRVLLLGLSIAGAIPSFAETPAPTGQAWKSIPVTYQVFQHSAINGVGDFQSLGLPAVQRAFDHWNREAVSCTRWEAILGGSFGSPSGLSAINPNDRINRILWLDGTDWTSDPSLAVVTTVTSVAGTGEIIDVDIQLNNNLIWSVGNQPGAYDIESVLTREVGHFLGLPDANSPNSVLSPYYQPGTLKTELAAGDRRQVCNLYPAAGDGGRVGSFCDSATASTDCPVTVNACRGLLGANSASKICTPSCSTDPDCPMGYTCQNAAGGGKACFHAPGAPDLCRFCGANTDCSSGLCATDGSHAWCSVPCTSAGSCGPGYTCTAPNANSTPVCVPQGFSCPTTQCASASDCSPGFQCNNGMCETTGLPDDRCEVTGQCQGCSICAADGNVAYCRACCGNNDQSALCANCTNTSCGETGNCLALTSDNPSPMLVCQSSGGHTGEPCDSSSPCESSAQCVRNRCHANCNPNVSGVCSVCYSDSTTSGACAFLDEIASTGELCGLTSDGLRVCSGGDRCIGQPARCMSPCDTPGIQSNCQDGKICTLVNSMAVCLDSNQSGTLCNGCNGGNCGPGLECFQGRCYQACNTAAPSCGANCISLSAGGATQGICACDDQRNSPRQSCGVNAAGASSCTEGALCLSGTCFKKCLSNAPDCDPGDVCSTLRGQSVCTTPGQPVPDADGGPPPDAGIPSPSTNISSRGCGCRSSGGSSAQATFLTLTLIGFEFVRRRRNDVED